MTPPRQIQAQDRPTIKVLINGEEIPAAHQVKSVETIKEFNRISSAKLVLLDGDAALENFELSSGEEYVPGNEIEIKAGYNDAEETLFKGVLVKQKITIRGSNTYLEIGCKDKSFRMSTSEKYSVFEEVSDSDIIDQIVTDYSLQTDIDGANLVHQNMVQYKTTDWDFVVSRAEANALVVLPNDNTLKIFKPEVKSSEDIALLFGATLLGFESELDATQQEEKLTAKGWDYSSAEALESESEIGDLSAGNLASTDLASGASINEEQTFLSGLYKQEELDKAAEAEQQRRRLSKIRGIAICQGTPAAPGQTIKLEGLGERFNGNLLVSGVSHLFINGNWTTRLQMGLSAENHLEKFKPLPKSAHFIPVSNGLEIGLVTDLDDPDGEFRVKIKLPVLGDETAIWARIAQVDAGDSRSMFFRPEVDDEVIVGFLNNDPRNPIIIGSLHSSNKPSPIEQNTDNHEKGVVTRGDMRLIFNDDKNSILIQTPNGNKIELSEDDGSITIEDENSNKCVMDSSGILLESSQDLVLKATGDLKLEGMNLELSANAQFKAEGSAGAELSTSAVAVIKGSLVQIN